MCLNKQVLLPFTPSSSPLSPRHLPTIYIMGVFLFAIVLYFSYIFRVLLISPNFPSPISTMSTYNPVDRNNDKNVERGAKINQSSNPSPTEPLLSFSHPFIEQDSALRNRFRTDGSVTETIVLHSVQSSALFGAFFLYLRAFLDISIRSRFPFCRVYFTRRK